MKSSLIILLFCTLLCRSMAYSQSLKPDQAQVALSFTNNFLTGQFDSCWAVLDKNSGPEMNIAQFRQLLTDARSELPKEKDSIELLMQGRRFFSGNEMAFYSFKYAEEPDNSKWYLFDVLFINDDSNLVVGFRPGQISKIENQMLSFEGYKTSISTNEEVKIKKKNYTVSGIDIVGLENNYKIIAIQTEQEVPSSLDKSELKAWAYKEGTKLAKWFFKSPHYENAVNTAKAQSMTLMSNLGISFIAAGSESGYNVMIKPSDYQD